MKKRSATGRPATQGAAPRRASRSRTRHNESEIAMLAAIMASPTDAIICRAIDGTVTTWNEGAQRMLGYSAAEAIGQPITFILPPELHSHVEHNTRRIIAGETVGPSQKRRITKDGRAIDVLTTLIPIRNEAGEITGAAIILHDITALRRAEAALTEREAWFGAAFEQAAVGMALRAIDPRNPRLIRVNQKLCDILGYTREELLQLTTIELTPPDERNVALDYNEKLLRGEITGYTREKRYLHKDGRAIWSNVSLSTIHGADCRTTHVIAVIEDISARKQAEQSRANLAAIVDGADDAIIGRTLEGTITSWNAAAQRMFGYAASEAIGQFIGLVVPGPLNTFAENNETLRRGSVIPARERVRVTKDGRRIDVSIGMSPIRDTAGEVNGAALIMRDISALKQAEALRAHLAAIVESSSDAIVSRTLNGTIISWNASAQRMFGYSASEAVGQHIARLILTPEARVQIAQNNEMLRRGETVAPHETRRMTKDGRFIDVMASASPIKNAAGETTGAAIIFHDISALKHAEAALKANEELMRTTFEQAAVGVVHTSLDRRYLLVNQKFCDIVGYSREELLAMSSTEITHREDLVDEGTYRAQMLAGELDTYTAEKRYVRKDGTVIWVNRTVSLARDGAGKPLYFIRMIEDISKRREAEDRFHATFEQAAVGIAHFAVDNFHILLANRKFCDLLGYTRDELIGTDSRACSPPDDMPARDAERAQILAGTLKTSACERQLLRKDGALLWVNRSLSLVRDPDGRPQYFISVIEDITERRQMDQALIESETRFRAIFDYAGVGITMRPANDRHHPWLQVNDRFCQLLGYPREELLRLSTADITAPDELADALKGNARLLSGKITNYTREKKVIRKDGSSIWVILAVALLPGSGGRPPNLIAAYQDITERKRAQEDQSRLAAIVENANDAIISRTPDDTIVSWNSAAERMFGWTAKEAIGKLFRELVLKTPASPPMRRFEQALRGAAIEVVEDSRLRRDGSQIQVQTAMSGIRNERGDVILVASIMRDITERKQAEESRARLAAIVDNAHDAIIGRTLDGTITSWNAAATRIFGYSEAEAIGRPTIMLTPEPLRRLAENNANLRRGLAIPASERTRVTKDGHIISVISSISPVRNAAGEVVSAAVITHDISELKQTQRELERLNRELEQRVIARTADLAAANREMEAFSYSVSHDLRAPLRAIGGFAQLVLDQYGGVVPPEARNFMERITRNVGQMGALIDGLLAYSKLQRQALRRRPVATAGLVRECLETLHAGEQGRSIELVVGSLPDCEADPVLLRQVWMNLLSNAFKFTGRREAARIEVGSLSAPQGVTYFVRDNGAGFDMRYVHKLFNVFQRLHHATEFAGHGIGLATIHNILQRHGGSIRVEAEPEKGAAFYFTLGGAGG